MKRILTILSLCFCLVTQAQITQYYQPHPLTRFSKLGTTWTMQYDSLGNGTWVAVASQGWVQGYIASHAGNSNSNIGTGFRLAVPNTNNVKTLIPGYGTLWDSTSTANTLTSKADTFAVSSRLWRNKGLDSVLGVAAATYVPLSRTVNGKALSSNITLSLASSDFSNQGTGTTVLHGNAAGNPAFSAVVEADISLSDLTTNNATSLKHGFLPKLSGNSSEYLNGAGGWSTPSGGSATNLGLGTRTATVMPLTSSTGTGVNLPLVDGSLAGLASPAMYLNSLRNITVRNANTATNYFKMLYVPNDSTGVSAGLRIIAGDSKLTVDTTGSTDSSKLVTLTVNAQSNIQYKNEGSNLGTAGAVTSVDFVGANIDATIVGSALTVTVTGSGSGSSTSSSVWTWTRSVSNKDSVNFDFTNLIDSGYVTFEVFFDVTPATDDDEFEGRFFNGSGLITTASYQFGQLYQTYSANGPGWVGNATDYFGIAQNVDNASSSFARGMLRIVNPNATQQPSCDFMLTKIENNTTTRVYHNGFAFHATAAQVKGIDFFFAGGNISTGVFQLRATK